MSSMNISHFLLCPTPGWGHLRPLCTLATRLVCEQETIIATLIVTPHVLDKTRTEVSRQFLDGPSGSSKALQRIRILSPSNFLNYDNPINPCADVYPATFQTLYDAKPITCSVTGTTFDAAPTPCAVILDFLAFPQLKATRAVSGHSVPIITFMAAGGAGSILRFFGPEYMGGSGDVGAEIDAEVARTGLSADEIGPKILNYAEGKLIRIPGLPVMQDYEFHPQKFSSGSFIPIVKISRGSFASFRECDAAIVATSYAFDSVSLDAMKEWFSGMQKKVHVLGPLLPPGYGTKILKGEEGASVDIEKFLGEMLVQHGERSIFFVSFGSYYWPPVTEYVDELIEALIAKRAPFILAYPSPDATISEQMAERIQSSGLGMITKWSPQQFILNHPATGWFISHGGFNSVTESLASGIPLIFFPLIGDQPINAAHVTENLHAAFELFQVRSGDGLKPLHRNGLTPAGTREAVRIEVQQTIDLCRSEKGQEIRSNAEKLKLKFAKAWEENGAAKQEARNFLNEYTRTQEPSCIDHTVRNGRSCPTVTRTSAVEPQYRCPPGSWSNFQN